LSPLLRAGTWRFCGGCGSTTADGTSRSAPKAAAYGQLGQLGRLRRHGCPWDAMTWQFAAESARLELLKWAREQDPACPSLTVRLH
jgi:hypothetical protein